MKGCDSVLHRRPATEGALAIRYLSLLTKTGTSFVWELDLCLKSFPGVGRQLRAGVGLGR